MISKYVPSYPIIKHLPAARNAYWLPARLLPPVCIGYILPLVCIFYPPLKNRLHQKHIANGSPGY